MMACAGDAQESVNTNATGSPCTKKPTAKTKSKYFRSIDMDAAHFPLRVKSPRALTVTEAGSSFFAPAAGREKCELRGVDLRRCVPVSPLQRELGLAGDFLRRHHVPERQRFIMRAAGQEMLVLEGSTQRRPKTAPTAPRGTVISCSSVAASISSVRVGNAKSTPNSFARSIIRSSISSRASSSAA